MDLLFSISNLLVLPFWLLMIFAPHWRLTKTVIASPWILIPPALLYAALVLPVLPTLLPLLANPTLEAVSAGIGTPLGATTVWAHLVTFDLLAGRWIYRDSRRRSLSAWLVSPVLALTLFLGPVGLLVYLLVRALTRPDDVRALA